MSVHHDKYKHKLKITGGGIPLPRLPTFPHKCTSFWIVQNSYSLPNGRPWCWPIVMVLPRNHHCLETNKQQQQKPPRVSAGKSESLHTPVEFVLALIKVPTPCGQFKVYISWSKSVTLYSKLHMNNDIGIYGLKAYISPLVFTYLHFHIYT